MKHVRNSPLLYLFCERTSGIKGENIGRAGGPRDQVLWQLKHSSRDMFGHQHLHKCLQLAIASPHVLKPSSPSHPSQVSLTMLFLCWAQFATTLAANRHMTRMTATHRDCWAAQPTKTRSSQKGEEKGPLRAQEMQWISQCSLIS